MKKYLLLILAVLSFSFAFAQEKGKFRVGLDLGYTIPTEGGGGILFYLEPKYNVADNINLGLRIGGAVMARDLFYDDFTEDYRGKVAANGSYLATMDYYFDGSGGKFVPFLGFGLGYYAFANIEVDSTIPEEDFGTLESRGALGGMLRGGFEYRKLRVGLEYNSIPKSNIQNLQGQNIGRVSNAYFGISIGFYVGGGKWGS
ncbi:hypothetical protein [Pararhodonellum marinum]|uniref:hypothetical protein n=1 Tax=Pararhodonellum marinum TaxID=2755358 RepID=UPI00188E626C|nr:hypothetical protein [Pararhodonellum marinum]